MDPEFGGDGDDDPKKGSTACDLVMWLFLFTSVLEKSRFVARGRGKVLMSS